MNGERDIDNLVGNEKCRVSLFFRITIDNIIIPSRVILVILCRRNYMTFKKII